MTNYQIYLFSQLFHNEFGEDLDEVPYDLLYPIIENELQEFLKSAYNTDEKSEYDCMVEYLTNKITITYAKDKNTFK
jgi:hypothetical protein